MSVNLTKTDLNAITLGDSDYINNKGANYYKNAQYDKAVEYYRIAAAMGNVKAITNLGYCCLYGRSIDINVSEAIALFIIASSKGDADATYKLGDIYSRDKWNVMDKELSVYYYRKAAGYIINVEWEGKCKVVWYSDLQRYPSLCYALARELAPEGGMSTNIELSYQFLKHAEIGYQKELADGADYYYESYVKVVDMLKSACYDIVRAEYDSAFDNEYSNDNEDE